MIAIIQACGANFTSIQFALNRLGENPLLTNDPDLIKKASHIILAGVGNARAAMEKLQSLDLANLICSLEKPVLGICLGMQILYEYSEEGEIDCLGIIPGKIRKLKSTDTHVIPHIGWNDFDFIQPNHFLNPKLDKNRHVYFVHSYAAPINKHTVAVTTYADKFTSITQYKNFIGMQFHPEKSADLGLLFLKRFIQMRST